MRLARIAIEVTAFLAAVAATLVAALLIFGVSLVPHTASNGSEIEAAFFQAAEFIDRKVQTTGRAPTQAEFQEWSADKGPWISRMELAGSSGSNSDLKRRFGEVPAGAYVLSVWRGEWSEYYLQGKGSTVDSALGLYASSMGVALGACGLSAVLWLVARRLKRGYTVAPQ